MQMGIKLPFLYNPIFPNHKNASRKLDIFLQDKGNSSSFGCAIWELSSD